MCAHTVVKDHAVCLYFSFSMCESRQDGVCILLSMCVNGLSVVVCLSITVPVRLCLCICVFLHISNSISFSSAEMTMFASITPPADDDGISNSAWLPQNTVNIRLGRYF